MSESLPTPPTDSPTGPANPGGDSPPRISVQSRSRRRMALFRRWARDTFSREQLLSGLRQLAWVAPLTFLIWVWAEREQQVKSPPLRFAVNVTSGDPKMAARLVEPSDGYVSLDLVGSRNRIEDLRRDMGTPIRFEVPAERREGEHQFAISYVAGRDPRLAGITVAGGSPGLITVLVDPFEEELVPVKVSEADRELFGGVVFNPPKVRVRIPKKERENKRLKGDQLFAYADLGAVVDKTPGRKQSVSGIRVYVPGADTDVTTIEPAIVDVSLAAVERAKTTTIPTLLVVQVIAPRLSEGKRIQIDPLVLSDIKITGPRKVIDQLEQTKFADVYAEVLIDTRDVQLGTNDKKPITFRLPEGAKVAPESAEKTVSLRITNSDGAP